MEQPINERLVTEEVSAKPSRKPIWEQIQDLMRDVPPEELAKLPHDGAEEHDHYLYGSPKRKET